MDTNARNARNARMSCARHLASAKRFSPSAKRCSHTRRLGVCVAAILAYGSASSAVSAAGEEPSIGTRIKAVFEQTKTAETVEDLTRIVATCEQLSREANTQARKDYLANLLSWAYNRRGEQRSARAADEPDLERAAALDDAALKDFERAVELDPSRWKAWHNRGVSYAFVGRRREAAADFTRTIQMQPDFVNAWFNRAEIRLETRRYAEALSDYEQVLRRTPQDIGARLGCGRCKLALGRHADAANDFTAALALDKDNLEAVVGRGECWQALGKWEQAAVEFRNGLRLGADDPVAHQAAAWLMATCPEERFRNPDLAVQTAKRAVALEESQLGEASARALDTLAAAYANAEALDQAVAAIREALERRENLNETAVQGLQQRLELYQRGAPFRLAQQGETQRR